MHKQLAWFVQQFGTERGRRLHKIIDTAARANDFDKHPAGLPYMLYTAHLANRLHDLSSILSLQMQQALNAPQVSFSNGVAVHAKTFWELPDINNILKDYLDAARAQAEYTKYHYKEKLSEKKVLVFRPNKMDDHPFSTYTDRDPRRLVFSGSTDRQLAQKYAGLRNTTKHIELPVDYLIDSFTTNTGFTYDEYEVRYIKPGLFDIPQ